MADKPYHALTDEEWKRVEKLLPATKKTGRSQIDSRTALNGKRCPVAFLACQIRQMDRCRRFYNSHEKRI